ncbi:MAG TPA: HD domain-containing phosphohydrolase [Longimicrobiales bacterium]|nr:HD domain-containing phosphohydrolase [Longimicrobiales bacterium]
MDTVVQQRMDSMEAAFIDSEDGNLFLQLAEAYRASGDVERALRILRKGLERHPAFTPAFALLGRVLHEAGRAAEAAVCFEQLLELDPANHTARAALDEIAASLGRAVAVPVAPPATNGGAHAPAPGGSPSTSQGSDSRTARTASAGDSPAAMPWEEPPRPHGDPLREVVPGGEAGGLGAGGAQEDDRHERRPQEPERREAQPSRPHGDPRHEDARPDERAPDTRAVHLELEAGLATDQESTAVALADLLVGLLEYRDPFFRGGTSMTRLLAAAIARELSLDDETVDAIALGAVLRDLGQIPLKGLIDKPGVELGAEGRKKLERHVDTALDMLEGVQLPAVARETIRYHHERWDGKGYPAGLSGDAIPLGARIVTAADSFAAMIAARPHRLPKRVPAALEDIRAGAGKQYDPAVVDALTRVLSSTGWRGLRFGLRHHVLVVDPDETRAMVIATKLCSNGYLAEAAFNLDSARERLDRTRIVALLISSELPDGDNFALMREVRESVERVGMIPVIVTDAGVTQRIALLEAGADVCLGRGASFEELKATLEAFLRREGKPVPAGKGKTETPWAGLQGDIQDFPLSWLMQVLNYDSRTAAVHLHGDEDEGSIYLEKGNPRHARTRELVGEAAFRAMLGWPHGSFSVDPDATTDEQSIRASLMNLLLEQAVATDHAAFFGAVKV